MNKTEKIRLIYSIIVGVFAVAIGIALICVAADIYYSGRGTGVVFTREIVSARLKEIAIPFFVLAGLIVCGVIFPLYDVKAKRKSEDALRLLSPKTPSGGEGEDYVQAAQNYKKLKLIRYIVWGVALAATLACTIASLCYLLDTANFKSENVTAEIFAMTKNVLPCVLVSFAALVAAAVVNGVLANRQLAALKAMIKNGNGTPKEKGVKWYEKILNTLSTDLALWIVRGAVAVVAVTFIIVGALNGGAHDVLVKAINICTECIGLG
ncbi:MAG: hypothetical protein HDT28_01445 [Clostridiales bacterium]|nr:hypothetical protein [Clostridiales bacterium]